MSMKRIEYKGMTINAAAFEVAELDRFISTLWIQNKRERGPAHSARLFSPPWPEELFADERSALDCAIAFGQSVIDGEVPGVTMEGAKED
jgi:hypothetical protein